MQRQRLGTRSYSASTKDRLFAQLLDSVNQAFDKTRKDAPSLFAWVQNINLDGRLFSFAGGHEYLEEIYRDTSSDITIEKAAQMGVSVWAILDSLHGMRFGRYPHSYLKMNGFGNTHFIPTLSL